MRKLTLLSALAMAALILLLAPSAALADGHMAGEIEIPAGYRTVTVSFDGIDPVSMDDGVLSMRLNGTVDLNDVVKLIDDQLAYGGSVEESCEVRMRWVPGSTVITSGADNVMNLRSRMQLSQRTCEPNMSLYTSSVHNVDYTVTVAEGGLDELGVSLVVNSISGLGEDSTMSAARLNQIADANITPVTAWLRAVASLYQTGCLATADAAISPVSFSSNGRVSVGINASGNLQAMSACVVLDDSMRDLAAGTGVAALILGDLSPGTVAGIVNGVLMGQMMSTADYITMVADDLADETWRGIVQEALRAPFVQDTVAAGMGDMLPGELAERLFSDAAIEQVWGGILLKDINPDTLQELVIAVATGAGDINALTGELVGQIQPASLALALARLLTLG